MCKEERGTQVLGRKGAVVMDANQAGRSKGCSGHDSHWDGNHSLGGGRVKSISQDKEIKPEIHGF